jgi:hypothetical protein
VETEENQKCVVKFALSLAAHKYFVDKGLDGFSR